MARKETLILLVDQGYRLLTYRQEGSLSLKKTVGLKKTKNMEVKLAF